MKKIALMSFVVLNSLQVFAQPAAPKGFEWSPVWGLTDEFNGFLNRERWYNYHPGWPGRLPSLFKKPDSKGNNPNVFTTNGKLALRSTLHKDPKKVKNPLKDHWVNAAAVVSKNKAAGPGMYFEARIKASNLSMTSSFWFRLGNYSEIDVIEHVGNPSNRSKASQEFEYAANTHYYGQYREVPRLGKKWIMPKRGREVFHNFGMFWAQDGKELKFYYNGKQVMKIIPRRPLLEKLHMIFDTEVFPFAQAGVAKIGLPRVGHLKNNKFNTMLVEYVRTWSLQKKKKGKKELSLEEVNISGVDNNIAIKQNPIKDNFAIIEGTNDVDVELYNLQGETVPSRIQLGADEKSIIVDFDTSVVAGVYILKTASGKSLKIIKE
ncbi:T9SS type A sorting domain-containing protein [Aquimarina agarilytica]|uniref:T9SS type A sorting domain-containing protein n=1 Tax=Aquimarina agarilytica TaxID=1087449 RepID=UPI00028A11B7|nr:T9SS type A sorting domain-containing protein [Aquimarina agarilytica]